MEASQVLAYSFIVILLGQGEILISRSLAGSNTTLSTGSTPGKASAYGTVFDVTVLNSGMTSISLQWSTAPQNDTVEKFLVHTGDSRGEMKVINITNTNLTTVEIGGLERGTQYWVYVQVFFSSTPALNSSLKTTITKGYGPDRSCNCDTAGTKHHYQQPLCNRTTGVCICKPGYTGKQCHICSHGYVRPLNNETCSKCPCPGDCIISAEHEWTCKCAEGHAGPFCDQCNFGYYKDTEQGKCLPCSDSATVCSSPQTVTALNGSTKGIIAGCSILALLLIFAVGGYIGYRRYKHWQVRRPGQFWTIEVRDNEEDSASMLENDYHNMIDANAMMEDLEHFDSNSHGVATPKQTGVNGEIRVAYNHNYRDKVT